MSLSRAEVIRLSFGVEELQESGYFGYRMAVWIALILTRECAKVLDDESRVRLAIAAGTAAEMGDNSLAVLAIRVIDPLLSGISVGIFKIDVGDLEELNLIRGRLNHSVGRHALPAG